MSSTKKVKRAVIYTRVSTGPQAEDDRQSLPLQMEKCKMYLELHDYELIGVYTDKGISGRNMNNRPGFKKALEAMENGDSMMVYSMSRIARNAGQFIRLMEDFSKNDKHLISLTENIDTGSAAGRLGVKLMSCFHEYESENRSEMITEAMRRKKLGGAKFKAPYGYRLTEDKKGYIEIEEEQEVIKMIVKMREEGEGKKTSYIKIGDKLNEMGIKTQTGKIWRSATVSNVYRRAKEV